MANPFKQAEEKKKVAPGGTQKPVNTVVEPVLVEPVVPEQEQPMKVGELLTGKLEPKPEGKSCSFYLSLEAIEKLEKFAKANKCSKSKAADIVFRNLY